MASITVISHLSVEQQAERLTEFLRERDLELVAEAATTVCAGLKLNTAGPSSSFTRRIKDSLSEHDIHLTHTVSLEVLARLCGAPNWMRTRQQMLALDSGGEATVTSEPVNFCLQPVRYDGVELNLMLKTSLSELATELLGLMQVTWPREPAPAFCTLGVGQKLLSLEFEHITAPWLTVRIWAFRAMKHESSGISEMLELPVGAVYAFVKKVERALEYAHPGLLVVGGTRTEELMPEYAFTPMFTIKATDFRRTCGSSLDPYLWLGACGTAFEERPGGVFALSNLEGEVLLAPGWRSEETGEAGMARITTGQLEALVNRIARLRRLTGLNMTEFIAANVNGNRSCESVNQVHMVDQEKVKAVMVKNGWSAQDLATKAGLPLNAAMRLLRYGYAYLDALPSLAVALGIDDTNELLPKDGEDDVGLRIETGDSFLRALKETHLWRRILGDSLQGKEAEEVNAIAESLQEYVELLQFDASVQRGNVRTNDARMLEPINESTVAIDVQELLDALANRGVGVVVSRSVKFMRNAGQFANMDKTPLHRGTLFFERLSKLRPMPGYLGTAGPRAEKTASGSLNGGEEDSK